MCLTTILHSAVSKKEMIIIYKCGLYAHAQCQIKVIIKTKYKNSDLYINK